MSDGPQQVWEELGPKPLQKREWLDSTRPSQLASARRPAAFSSSTPAEGWGARKKWSGGFLAAHEELQQLDGVYHHPSGKLLHHNPDAPLAADGDLVWEPPHRTLNCTSRCFFGALRSGRGGAAQQQPDCGECSRGPLSFTAELGPRFGSLWEDISGFEAFGVGSASPTAHMWIGAAGTTTLAHYDSYHNFFVQLQGSKRFFLMPPSAAEALYTFPRLHPSYRQAQLDLTLSMDSSRDRAMLEPFPRMKRLLQAAANTPVGALVVDLEPGDVSAARLPLRRRIRRSNTGGLQVLYIPPYWFHLAGSLPPLQDQTAKAATALSVGVNIWSDAEELRAVEAFESVALPFEETWVRTAADSCAAGSIDACICGWCPGPRGAAHGGGGVRTRAAASAAW